LGLVLPKNQAKASQQWIDELAIKCRSGSQAVIDLSGGNQQKVAIARLLQHNVDVFLLDEPTRGIDVGSKELIYRLIDKAAAEGRAVLIVSSYLPELLGVCDRIAVMHKGRLGTVREVNETTQEQLIAEAAGA
jgi:ribose transport system ATP-binding protein